MKELSKEDAYSYVKRIFKQEPTKMKLIILMWHVDIDEWFGDIYLSDDGNIYFDFYSYADEDGGKIYGKIKNNQIISIADEDPISDFTWEGIKSL